MTGDAVKQTRADISALAVWLVCVALYAPFMWFAFTDPNVLKGELGLLENTQTVLLLIAFVLGVRLVLQKNEKWLRWWLVLICVGIFYLLTEETSWGQHYFGWDMGGFFSSFNDQGENNIHNSDSWFDQKPRAMLLLGMILGTIVHPLVKRFRKGRGLFDNPWWLAPTLVCLGAGGIFANRRVAEAHRRSELVQIFRAGLHGRLSLQRDGGGLHVPLLRRLPAFARSSAEAA